MPSPSAIDSRFDELVRELRAGAPPLTPELQRRIRVIAREDPRGELPVRTLVQWRASARRLAFGGLAFCLFIGCVAALVAGLLAITNPPQDTPSAAGAGATPAVVGAREFAPVGTVSGSQQHSPFRARPSGASGSASAAPAPSGTRLQDYEAWLRLRVGSTADLSRSVKRALAATRSDGGYVETVSYDVPGRRTGTAELVLRVPIGRVQDAIAQFSSLGTIVGQHVSIQDLQRRVNGETAAAEKLRTEIARIRAELRGALATSDRDRLGARLARDLTQLTATRKAKSRDLRRAEFSRVALTMITAKAAAVVHHEGRLHRALRHALGILGRELLILLYVLIVLGPLALLAAAAVFLNRARNRRAESQLLEGT